MHSHSRLAPAVATGVLAGIDGREAEVQGLLDRLATAVTIGDGLTAASLWSLPAFVIGDNHEWAVQSALELVAFFDGAKAHYNQRGIGGTHAQIERLEWITERLALVRVRWPWLDADGREVGEETSSYLLKRDDDGALKLRAAFMHGATDGGAAPRPS